MITYRNLLESLKCLSQEQLDMTASIFDENITEVIPLHELKLASEITDNDITDVVDVDQPLMVVR